MYRVTKELPVCRHVALQVDDADSPLRSDSANDLVMLNQASAVRFIKQPPLFIRCGEVHTKEVGTSQQPDLNIRVRRDSYHFRKVVLVRFRTVVGQVLGRFPSRWQRILGAGLQGKRPNQPELPSKNYK